MQAGRRNTHELKGSSVDTRQASQQPFLPLAPGAHPSRPVPTLRWTPVGLAPACDVHPSLWQWQRDGGQASPQPCAVACRSGG